MPSAEPSPEPWSHRSILAHSHSSIDLQLAVLRAIPTPTLVLSPSRTVVFANRTAAKLLGSRDPIQSSYNVLGRSPEGLGVRLLYDKTWDDVLTRLGEEHGRSQEGEGKLMWDEEPIHEVEVEVSNAKKDGDCLFRVLLTTLIGGDGMHFVLSFEKSSHQEAKPITRTENSEEKAKPSSITNAGNLRIMTPDAILRLKKGVFDSCDTAAFILTLEKNFYLANKKARAISGNVMGGPEGCDGLALRGKLEIWNEDFTRTLDEGEFPGVRLVRDKTPFVNYRCGFSHSISGKKTVMSMSGECLYDDDTGEFMGGICWCTDMQDYQEFQAQKLRSHETICNSMPHLVWTTTDDGYCDWYSDRWYSYTGMSKEESLGTGFEQAIHPDDLAILAEKWYKKRDAGEECECEVRYRRADGVYKWTLARAVPYRDETGKILKWYGTNTDIHELVMSRIEAARNKLQVMTVLAHSEVYLFQIDKDKKITLAEGAMGWDVSGNTVKSQFIGKDTIEVSQASQPGGIPGYEKNILDILSGKVDMAVSEDLVRDRTYRTRVVADLEHNTADCAQAPEVVGVLGLSIDVTDMKARAQLEIDNTRLSLEEQAAKDSNRLKSQFLANMSHELRTPTAGVIGMVELLSEDTTLNEESRDFVNSIQLSAKALLAIVNDILDFSKIESGRLDIEEVPFNLAGVVGEVCKLLSMFAVQKGLNFVYENYMDEGLEVLGDPGRIRQVLSNLLTNALKFTTEGSVKITVNSEPTLGGEGLEVTFVIVDSGIGIEKHVLERLFQPFSQGDASTARLFGGTGLGLTISKNLATLMNGSITLSSEAGVGSKATFTVPLKIALWCRNPTYIELSPRAPGFRFDTSPSRTPSWTQQLAQRPANKDIMHENLLNQEISSAVTNGARMGFSKPPSLNEATKATLSLEERNKIHVLVVEDNAINQTIALKTIQKLGFSVTAVWNGKQALSYLLNPSETQPRPDIILMDVQMPVMDGYQATKLLRTGEEYNNGHESTNRSVELDGIVSENSIPAIERRSLRDIPVIAMTASAIQGDKEKCCNAGMDDYLSKPVERHLLEEKLVKWARRRRVEDNDPALSI